MTGMANCTPSREGDYDRFQDVQDSETLPDKPMCRCGCRLPVDDGGICADGRSEAEHLAARVHALTSQLAALTVERTELAAELHDTKHYLAAAEQTRAMLAKEAREDFESDLTSIRDWLNYLLNQ